MREGRRRTERPWPTVAAILVATVVAAVGVRFGAAALGEHHTDVPRGPTASSGDGTGSGTTSGSGTTTGSDRPSTSHGPAVPHPIPGFLLIADRGNDRMLLVDSHHLVLWRYPKPGSTRPVPFRFDDDTFFTPRWRGIISNQEDQQTIQIVSFPGRNVEWVYGHVNAPGAAPGFLHTPDDAYMLEGGTRTVADVHNCRVLFISGSGRVVRTYGTTGVCRHDPPRFLASPNGDTPLPGGGMIVTEITGSWIDGISATGTLMWSVHAPTRYPSDAQWLGDGKLLLADYSSPGHVLIMTTSGKVLFRYGPDSGPGALKYPSLALMLPNHLIAVNDDDRHRVVLIDPRRHRIVWHYGHTDVTGTGLGFLDTPDGMDFLLFAAAMRIPAIRAVVARSPGRGP